MKLETLDVLIVKNPPPGHGGRYFIFVILKTACGIKGVGEVYAATFGPDVVKAMIEDVFARYLEGTSPHQIERFWRRTHGSGFTHRPDLSMQGVVSGLEMACWDIIGKAADRPVYDLLGGKVHDRLRSYTYLYPNDDQDPGSFYSDPVASAETAALRVAEGFSAVKFDPAGQYTVYDGRIADLEAMDRSESFCKLIREAVGDKADMLFGTHGQFSAAGAIRMAQRLEKYQPLWFEEPTPPDMPEEMAKVARGTTIPVATGERLCTKFEFGRVIDSGAAAILQPDLGRVGGILEAKKIAAMAEARYIQVAPHLYCGPIVAAANIQLATMIPNFLIIESIGKMDGFHGQLVKNQIKWEDGYIIPPTVPGLGVELDEDVARAHPWDGGPLHLEMGAEPYDASRHRLFPGG